MTRSRSMNYTNDSYEFRAPHAAAAASLMANSYTMGESSTSRPYSSGESSTSRPYSLGESSSTSRTYSSRPSSYYSKFLSVNLRIYVHSKAFKIVTKVQIISKANCQFCLS